MLYVPVIVERSLGQILQYMIKPSSAFITTVKWLLGILWKNNVQYLKQMAGNLVDEQRSILFALCINLHWLKSNMSER